jgi:asparagine synthase (glutamine-hydrolysing)
MNDRLTHRGPDADGYWCQGSVGFGHRRLSIIDIAGSPQPMSSPDGHHHVCFNGEILNYRALRATMPYPYRTAGDTETLLAAYQAHGADLVQGLHGQFAFAIYDGDTAELLLFRDRLGILPLYYYADCEMIAFASEIKALLPALPREPEMDEASLDDYLALRSVPAPFTLFKGVYKLPAGHLLRAGSCGRMRIERYWGIPEPTAPQHRPSGEFVGDVAEALEGAVAASLVADAPVGAYLSGGVDSSLIVALMRKLRGGEEVTTFAAGFGDARHDELPFARRVSELLGTRHHEVRVAPSDLVDLWPRLTWHRDAPMSEPADFAVHRLALRASESVKVVLSGEGSDELFAGYPKYVLAPLIEQLARLPAPARARLSDAIDRWLPPAASRMRVPARVLGVASAEERRRAWFAPFTEVERAELVGRWGRHPRPPLVGLAGDVVQRMLAADCQVWLPDNLLERGDRMTMSASVELRPPFLDHHLVELAFSLPTKLKVRGHTTKWIVKEIARRHLPDEIVSRRKVGFRLPLDVWLRGELQDMAWDLLTSPQSLVSSVTDKKLVRRLLERHRSGEGNEEIRIWTLLCLEVWHHVFFKGRPPVGAPPPPGRPARPVQVGPASVTTAG